MYCCTRPISTPTPQLHQCVWDALLKGRPHPVHQVGIRTADRLHDGDPPHILARCFDQYSSEVSQWICVVFVPICIGKMGEVSLFDRHLFVTGREICCLEMIFSCRGDQYINFITRFSIPKESKWV